MRTPARNAKLNKFDLTHDHKTTLNMGILYPVSFFEVLPNDWLNIKNEFLLRFMALVSPVMHQFNVSLHWWYCPTRLLFKGFEDFITGGPEGTDDTVRPYFVTPEGGVTPGSLSARLRVPHSVGGLEYNAYGVRMYNHIWNEYYRNQNLQDPVENSTEPGLDTTSNLQLLRRNWERDYYTDATATTSKGPQVLLPLGTEAPVSVFGDGNALGYKVGSTTFAGGVNSSDNNADTWHVDGYGQPAGTVLSGALTGLPNKSSIGVTDDPEKSGLIGIADLSQASAISINALRYAGAVQQFQEANLIYGNRYAEFIPNMYNVLAPDASLQRALFLGGSTTPTVISEVLQTSASTEDSPQGNMAGHGVAYGTTPTIRFHSREFGYVMCLLSVMPRTGYYQGLPRDLDRATRFDYALPLFAHTGMQTIKNKEIFAQGTDADEEPWGYTWRFDDYRSINNTVSGEFAVPNSMMHWTAVRSFSELPPLNGDFVSAKPTTDIFAVQTDTEGNDVDHLYCQVLNHVKALRPIPKTGLPGMHII